LDSLVVRDGVAIESQTTLRVVDVREFVSKRRDTPRQPPANLYAIVLKVSGVGTRRMQYLVDVSGLASVRGSWRNGPCVNIGLRFAILEVNPDHALELERRTPKS